MFRATSFLFLCFLAAAAPPAASSPSPAPAPRAPAQGPSVKDLFDGILGELRRSQRPDGSYGNPQVTAQVLIAMATSPRSYREDDGPFVRLASRWLMGQTAGIEDPGAAATAALALQCLDGDRYGETIAELAGRAGMEAGGVAALAAGRAGVAGKLPEAVRAGLPLPGERSAREILAGAAEATDPARLAEIAARAGLALRREQAQRAGQPPDAAEIRRAYQRGAEFLLRTQEPDGLWHVFGRPEPGISALAARALLGSPRPEVRQAAQPTLDHLRGLQKEDGSIHAGHLPVYVTSVAVRALAASGQERDQPILERAAGYLRWVQADAGEGYSEADKFYGGIGYGSDLRPDLSNLQYALQALRDAGVPAEDPAFQRALVFLQRTQNRSESNPGTYFDAGSEEPIRAGNDGGAVYYPGNSPAGTIELAGGTRVARSYGSMTYALLKCYLFAGLERDDPRVQAATDWISRHWTLEVNPGFDTLRDPRAGFQGLYYYYLSLAEALDAAGMDFILTPSGSRHDWRAELAAKLISLQREDGSWVNDMAERWWEGNPVLCTSYALNALQVIQK